MSAPGDPDWWRDVQRQMLEPAEPRDWWGLGALLIVACMLGIGLTCIFFGYARAAEPEQQPRWQLVECPPDQPCRPRGKALGTLTACELDSVSLAIVAVKATRISCKRIGK